MSGEKAMPKIFVVEDEGVVRLDIQQKLQDLGYDVPGTAASGEAALEKVAKIRPNLVLMDIRLEGDMDGVETAQILYEHFGVPVVFLSAYSDENIVQQVKTAKSFGYILKPFDSQDLYRAIEIALYKHQADKELWESEERYRRLLEGIGQPVFIVDRDGQFLFMNQVAAGRLGGKTEDLVGKSMHDLFPEEVADGQLSTITQAIESGETQVLESKTVILGENRWYDSRIYPWRSKGREIDSALGISIDITTRKQAEEALQESEEKYRNLVEDMDEGIASVDEKEDFTFVNQAVSRIFRCPKEELIGKNLKEWTTPEAYREILEQTSRRKAGRSDTYDLQIIRRDGTVKDLIVTTNPIVDENGQYSGASAIFRDITERKREEKALRRVYEDLGQRYQELDEKNRLLTAFHRIGQTILSTLNLDSVLDNLASHVIEAGLFRSLMIALVDEENQTVTVVRSFIKQKGSIFDTIERNGLHYEGPYRLDDTNITAEVARTGQRQVIVEWDPRFDRLVDTPEGKKGKVAYFLPIKYKERVLAVLATGSQVEEKEEVLRRIDQVNPLLDQFAIALEHARLYEDIQKEIIERGEMQRELVRLERQRAFGELSQGICHNLNNILSGILGPAALLEGDREIPHAPMLLESILTSTVQAAELVRRLHQAVADQPRGALQPVDINAIVRDAVLETRPRWKDEADVNGIHIEVVAQLEDIPAIRGEASETHDILSNLILNAIDALPQGGVITIHTLENGERVQLVFSDTGIGMDEETREKVFEPFFTTKMDVGHGLGLSTVYNSVTQWGGTIEVKSAPEEGTAFTLEFLPWQDDTAGKNRNEEEESIALPARLGKVLIVEDDERTIQMLSIVLEDYDVDVVTDGLTGLQQFASDKYEVVLIDLVLPGLPGDKLMQKMREQDPRVVSVLTTGWILQEDDPRISLFDFWLEKPLFPTKVLDTVKQAGKLYQTRVEEGK